jgi:glycerol-3-phosphate acyltransferase PlsY
MDFVFAALVGYIIGMAPVALRMAKSRGIDLRNVGTGNVGTSNAYRYTGKSIGALTLIIDMGKGYLSPLLVNFIGMDLGPQLLASIGAITGQMWPVTSKFQGGRGNATAGGACFYFDQVSFFIAMTFFVTTTFPKIYKILRSSHSETVIRSRMVPITVILAFIIYGLLSMNAGNGIVGLGAVSFILLILVRRATAPWPPDPITGAIPNKSLFNTLLLDRPDSN